MNSYDTEVKKRWGDSPAHKEYQEKTANYTEDKWQEVNSGLNEVFFEFAECMKNGSGANSERAQSLVKRLKDYISENYYTCTDEILKGLGQMYITDERFKQNIDKNALGTAEFVSKAIEYTTTK